MGILVKCEWCDGLGFDPQEESCCSDCFVCSGGRFQPIGGDLGATKSNPNRPYIWNPGRRILSIMRRGKQTRYTVKEYQPDPIPESPEARAFLFTKQDGAQYFVLFTRQVISCDCPACEWETSRKAMVTDYIRGEQVYDTLGCVHADFIRHALKYGMLDAPQSDDSPTTELVCDPSESETAAA